MEYGGSDGEVGFWPRALVWPVEAGNRKVSLGSKNGIFSEKFFLLKSFFNMIGG